jgi:D-aminoacyl-tRNA deacylase
MCHKMTYKQGGLVMRVLLQRVNHASVKVNGEVVGSIQKGLMLLTGFGKSDTAAALGPMAQKLVNLRVFPEGQSHFHLSLLDVKGGALLVPQFTLFADTSKGRRPDFFGSLEPDKAGALFEQFVSKVKEAGVDPVQTGVFGAYMQVDLENDGPVTIMVEI